MRDTKPKVLFIGGTNLGGFPGGGEEYKNQLLVAHLEKRLDITLIDTHAWRKRPLLLLDLFYHLFFVFYDFIIVSVTTVSAYRLFRIMALKPKLLTKTVYWVIGGNLLKEMEARTVDYRCYVKLKYILVEGNSLEKSMQSRFALSNVRYVPNFKPFVHLDVEKNRDHFRPFRFVFLSSIMEEKGVSVILEAAGLLSKHLGPHVKMEIDFYGLFESEEYKAFFESELAGLKPWVRYKGYLDIRSNPAHAYQILAGYDCLLFPTKYPGEGFPGVLLDAFIAGLPIICSDWNMNSEIVSHGKQGIILKENTAHELMNAMLYMNNDRVTFEAMSIACRASAQQFDTTRVLDKTLNELLQIRPVNPQDFAV